MILRYCFFALLLLLFLTGCLDDENDYNKRPANLSGNIFQMLREKGEYNYFLRAAELTNYSSLLDGGGLVTVFAPDDAAFKRYLQEEYQADSLSAIPENDLKVLVAYHIVEFAYTTDDFLGFSASATADNPIAGDGSCYKYKTLAKEGITPMTDPVTKRKINAYSREKYLPVVSTRLFENRKSPDAEKDYKSFFPTVNWSGDKDKLYVGDAAVKESGLPTSNGYLYTLDRVVKPLPTIYKALGDGWAEKYSLYKKLFDRFSYFEYQADLSKNYAQQGDSLFLLWHYKKPQTDAEIPEIASEWSYHDEAGKLYEKALRYAVTCLAPEDAVLEPFLRSYFKEFGTESAGDDYLEKIPNNAIFHLLQAYAYDKMDLVIPSELVGNGIVGVNGEHFEVAEEEIQDIRFCANGMLYGINKCLVPAVFTHLARPLFQYPDFQFYALAFNQQGLYQQTIDPNNRYTLFIQDDETMSKKYAYTYSESTKGFGVYQFQNNRKDMAAAAVANLILTHLTFGEVKDPKKDPERRRYYVSRNYGSYFYAYDGEFYDETHKTLVVKDTFMTDNGLVYYMDRRFEKLTKDNALVNRLMKPDLTEFCKLLQSVGLVNGTAMPFAQQAMAFIPTNEAVTAGIAAGKIPVLGRTSTAQDTSMMIDYLKYYFVPKVKNKLEYYLLPGLGLEGATDEDFDLDAVTLVDYKNEVDARRVNISWQASTPNQLILTNTKGNRLITQDVDESPFFARNGVMFLLDDCFDYRDILE